MVFMFIVGISFGFNGPIPLLVRELVEENEYVDATGLLCFCTGCFASLGPPSAGWIYDSTGSYTPAFILTGSVSVAVGLLMFVDICCWGKASQHVSVNQSDQVTRRQSLGVTMFITAV
eukprot:m.61930 g.61930  ORF g.61930 m.61930 type:complete len:118 (+) comp35026_c0_seq1:814-1167(+)